MSIQTPKGFITITEAEQHSTMSSSELRRLVREATVDGFEAGGRWYIGIDSLHGYLNSQPAPEPKTWPKPPPGPDWGSINS